MDKFSFAAINKRVATVPRLPSRDEQTRGDMVVWGANNLFPDYLLSLADTVPTLRSIISGNIGYVLAGDVVLQPFGGNEPNCVNRNGQTIREQLEGVIEDVETFGGFALLVIRDRIGGIAELYNIPMERLRTSKTQDEFWHSFEWSSRKRIERYPAFDPNGDAPASVLWITNNRRGAYPIPQYGSALQACETERQIDEYNLSSICNGFAGSLLVNFNNGVPSDEIRAEIERDFSEKFTGAANAGRVLFSWNRDKETATELVTPQIQDYADRFETVAKRARQQIFTAFRANPNLFGIPTENTGFSRDEYAEAYRLYEMAQILPKRRIIEQAYNYVLGVGVLEIRDVIEEETNGDNK